MWFCCIIYLKDNTSSRLDSKNKYDLTPFPYQIFSLYRDREASKSFMMNNKFLNLQSFVVVVLCLFAATTFSSCSDDDEPKDSKSIVGIWTESFYDDVIEFKADGSGYWAEYYGDPTVAPFTWTFKDGLLTIIDDDDWEQARVVSQTEDIIVWNHYVDNPKAYGSSVIKEDDYGYYYVWIWKRYTR